MATSSLRKRLERGDLEGKPSHLLENFCMIGTPLPALDSKDYDANESKPIWEQEARDAQGRRRFHGAFTGGFSAGYFNTVGSKEGWTPSTFRSTRADKEKAKSQGLPGAAPPKGSRPEDFMDEEDLQDLKEAREITATDRFQGTSSRGQTAAAGDTFGADFLDSLVQSKPSTVGVTILKRMGWKEGQGLGPRVTAARRAELIRLYEQRASAATGEKTPTAAETLRNDEEAQKFLFPPPDTQLLSYDGLAKADRRGLGFQQSASMADLLRRVHEERRAVAERPRPAAALDSDDDEDAYADDLMGTDERAEMARSTLAGVGAYSRDVHGQKDRIVLKNGVQDTAGRADEDDKVWADGRPVPAGFRRSLQPLQKDAWFAPPPIPAGWKPDPSRVLAIITANAQGQQNESAGIVGTNARPEERASVLGEAKVPGPAPALSDYLSAKAQERFAAASARPTAPKQAQPSLKVPVLDPSLASSALRGFIPFGTEPAKQERYKQYLQSQVDRSGDALRIPDGMDAEQATRELEEFHKSATIFRPMNTAMAGRFVSSSSTAAAKEFESPRPGLHQPTPASAKQPEANAAAEAQAAAAPAQEERAEATIRVGSSQRTIQTWIPGKLLCKRFGVPDPHPNMRDAQGGEDGEGAPDRAQFSATDGGPSHGKRKPAAGAAMATWEANKRSIQAMVQERGWAQAAPDPVPQAFGGDAASTAATATAARPLDQVGLGNDATQGRDTLTYVKPSMAVFKAVFASDDEDSEDEEGAAPGTKAAGPSAAAEVAAPAAKAAPAPERTLAYSPAEGIQSIIRPTFVAKSKRASEPDAEAGADAGTTGPDEEGGGKAGHKKRKKESGSSGKKKRKSDRNTLSFGMDEEEQAEETAGPPPKARKVATAPAPVVVPAQNQGASRPRASDLF